MGRGQAFAPVFMRKRAVGDMKKNKRGAVGFGTAPHLFTDFHRVFQRKVSA